MPEARSTAAACRLCLHVVIFALLEVGVKELRQTLDPCFCVAWIAAKCITEYTELSIARSESSDPDADAPLDPRLVTVVEKMLDM